MTKNWRELETNQLMDFFEQQHEDLQPKDLEDLMMAFEREVDEEIKILYESILQIYGTGII